MRDGFFSPSLTVGSMMAKAYAGILGLLAFTTVLLRGLLHGFGLESTVGSALLALICFAVVGFVAAQLADSIVLESARQALTNSAHDSSPSGPGDDDV